MSDFVYVVVGAFDEEANHEFGEYAKFGEARRVWAAHDDDGAPVRIEKRDRNGDTVRTWRGGWTDEAADE